MHEWALAESVLTAALDEAKKQNLKKIVEIIISIGELQQIEKDIFMFALDQLMKEQKKSFKIKIETEKSVLKCRNCEHTWGFSDTKKKLGDKEIEDIHFIPEVAFVHMRCPVCSNPDFEIVKGRGVTITQIKGEK